MACLVGEVIRSSMKDGDDARHPSSFDEQREQFSDNETARKRPGYGL